MEVGGQVHVPAALPPGEGARTHFTGESMGHRVSLDACWENKISYPWSGFEPTTILSVEMRSNDRSIPTRHFWTSEDKSNLICVRETSDI